MTTKNTTTALVVYDEKKVQALDAVADEYAAALAGEPGKFKAAFITANAVAQLREMISPDMLRGIMSLMNTRLGFLTDKNPNRPGKEGSPIYPENVVRDVVVEMALRGVPFVGNCFNIIAGNGYVTKEGLTFLLKNPRLAITDLRIDFGVPRSAANNGGALVPFQAAWKVKGVSQDMSGEIPVRVNDGMGADAILGKADRKVKARIYARVSGTELTDGDVDVDALPRAEVIPPAAVKPDAMGDALRTAAGPKAPPPSAPASSTNEPPSAVEPPPAPAPQQESEPAPQIPLDKTAGDIPSQPKVNDIVEVNRDGNAVRGTVTEIFPDTIRVKRTDNGKVITVQRMDKAGNFMWRHPANATPPAATGPATKPAAGQLF